MKIDFKKIKKIIKKLILICAKCVFLSCLIIFFISIAIGAIFLYKYGIASQKIKSGTADNYFSLDEKKYQELLDNWKEQEERFNRADIKDYLDPFNTLSQTATPD